MLWVAGGNPRPPALSDNPVFNTLYILNVIKETKRVLNKERNNTYLAEASIFPTLYHYMLLTLS